MFSRPSISHDAFSLDRRANLRQDALAVGGGRADE